MFGGSCGRGTWNNVKVMRPYRVYPTSLRAVEVQLSAAIPHGVNFASIFRTQRELYCNITKIEVIK